EEGRRPAARGEEDAAALEQPAGGADPGHALPAELKRADRHALAHLGTCGARPLQGALAEPGGIQLTVGRATGGAGDFRTNGRLQGWEVCSGQESDLAPSGSQPAGALGEVTPFFGAASQSEAAAPAQSRRVLELHGAGCQEGQAALSEAEVGAGALRLE